MAAMTEATDTEEERAVAAETGCSTRMGVIVVSRMPQTMALLAVCHQQT